MRSERGTSLLEVLTVGFLVVAIALQALVALTRLSRAGDEVAMAAEMAAAEVVATLDRDTGVKTVARLSPGSDVVIVINPESVEVQVSKSVSLVGPERSPVTRTVRGRAVIPINPYRSRP